MAIRYAALYTGVNWPIGGTWDVVLNMALAVITYRRTDVLLLIESVSPIQDERKRRKKTLYQMLPMPV